MFSITAQASDFQNLRNWYIQFKSEICKKESGKKWVD